MLGTVLNRMLSRIRLFYDVEQESGKTPGALAGTTVLYPGAVCEIEDFFWIGLYRALTGCLSS